MRPYDLGPDFTIGSCLFKAVSLPKNARNDSYGYSSYAIGFHAPSAFSLS